MPDERIDEEALDDLALEMLAEAHATAPPPELRQRLLATAHLDATAEQARRGRARWRIVGAVAATLLLVGAGLLGRNLAEMRQQAGDLEALRLANANLSGQLEAQDRRLAALQVSLEAQAQMMKVLGGPTLRTASLKPSETFQGSGRVHVDPETGEGVVVLTGVAPLPPDKVYELWAIRGSAPPEPAGLIQVAGQKAGAPPVFVTPVKNVANAAAVTAFAVSIEPTGGSKSPTGPVVLVGPVAS